MKESDLEAQAEAISTIVGASPRLWGGWVRYWRDEWDVSGALAIHLQPLNHCFDIKDTSLHIHHNTHVPCDSSELVPFPNDQ